MHGHFNKSLTESVAFDLRRMSRSRGRLHGSDLDLMTETMDAVVSQLNTEVQDGNKMDELGDTVHAVFEVRALRSFLYSALCCDNFLNTND